MNFIKALLLLLFVCAAQVFAASDEIIKCTEPDGRVVYTNMGCETSKAEVVTLQPITIIESPESNFSFLNNIDISPMWLVLAVYVLMSVICFLAYWADKKRSIKGEWRIPEINLHVLELLGGWPGALIAQRKLRHKNRKGSYQLGFWFIVVVHLLLWIDYFTDHEVLFYLLTRLL